MRASSSAQPTEEKEEEKKEEEEERSAVDSILIICRHVAGFEFGENTFILDFYYTELPPLVINVYVCTNETVDTVGQ